MRSALKRNQVIHDRIAAAYEKMHGEIFNSIEQERLQVSLLSAIGHISSSISTPVCFDFGCGSGNLTRHLLSFGYRVIGADVSKVFLQQLQARFTDSDLSTIWLDDGSLSSIPSCSYDFVCTYSVLHHVPDYLQACIELARICRPGGVVYIDHEHNEDFWKGNPVYLEFRTKASKLDWKKYLRPINYYHKVMSFADPRYTNEGDIHVWPDDHVEWKAVEDVFLSAGFEIVLNMEYLLFNSTYRMPIYEIFKGRCSDMRVMAFRKVM